MKDQPQHVIHETLKAFKQAEANEPKDKQTGLPLNFRPMPIDPQALNRPMYHPEDSTSLMKGLPDLEAIRARLNWTEKQMADHLEVGVRTYRLFAMYPNTMIAKDLLKASGLAVKAAPST